jgi:hypothetical protein
MERHGLHAMPELLGVPFALHRALAAKPAGARPGSHEVGGPGFGYAVHELPLFVSSHPILVSDEKPIIHRKRSFLTRTAESGCIFATNSHDLALAQSPPDSDTAHGSSLTKRAENVTRAWYGTLSVSPGVF